ncbi:DUF892 family protein [Mucilaginibacter conchicola]|uniref:DUF892 family protein n=1 Tax=Mucilaginibacter conchicola TaxID=2303333 RepID=A0A372NYS8_9SPHI|nr:DUF892 family protein [Mucilaginibacter conchicola]RFZ94819.1 DUF892 family protein [Mucilaginibacter conchicola]
MQNPPEISKPVRDVPDTQLFSFLTASLLSIYRTKRSLVTRLPKIACQAASGELKSVMMEITNDLAVQILRLDKIFALLGFDKSLTKNLPVFSLNENTFQSTVTKNVDPMINEFDILLYISNLESMDIAAFPMVLSAADKLGFDDIRQLLQECFDDANDNRALIDVIVDKYLAAQYENRKIKLSLDVKADNHM